MRKILSVVAFTLVIGGCNKGSSTLPTAPEIPTLSGPTAVTSQAYDPNLKRNISASVSGTTVTGEVRTIYNEDLGQVAMLVFRSDANPQILLAETLQAVKGPVGNITYFSAQIPKLCSKPLQVDFIYAPRGITDAMRGNHFNPSEFLDAEYLTTDSCTPKPSPSPTCDIASSQYEECPPVDVCPNLEGLQSEVPDGYYLDEEGQCVHKCDEEGSWVAQEPTYEYGEWGECGENLEASTGNHNPPPSCSRSRTVTVVVYEVNSCTQERREKSRESRQESEPCECPPPPTPDYCYYNISGSPVFKFSFCTVTGGEWGNWNGQQNHCRYEFPGISSVFAQLTPGQSESGCLSKHDD